VNRIERELRALRGAREAAAREAARLGSPWPSLIGFVAALSMLVYALLPGAAGTVKAVRPPPPPAAKRTSAGTPFVTERVERAKAQIRATAEGTAGSPLPSETVDAILYRFGRLRSEARQSALAESVREREAEFTPALLEVLGNENHPQLLAALEIVRRAAPAAAGSRLIALANSPDLRVRAAAIRAGIPLGIWSLDAIAEFLHQEDPAVLAAALEAAAASPGPHLTQIIPLLGHRSAMVQHCAVAAMPDLGGSPEGLAALCRFAVAAEDAPAIVATRALARTSAAAAAEDCLVELLRRPSPRVRQAALLALARRLDAAPPPAGPPGAPRLQASTAQALVAVAGEAAAPTRHRVAALAALERGGRVPLAVVRHLAADADPCVRVGAARCLLSAAAAQPQPGDEPPAASPGRDAAPPLPQDVTLALDALIEVLGMPRGTGVNADDAGHARTTARSTLAELFGEDLGAEPQPWRERREKSPRLAQRAPSRAMDLFW
jgi:hypothetical protein